MTQKTIEELEQRLAYYQSLVAAALNDTTHYRREYPGCELESKGIAHDMQDALAEDGYAWKDGAMPDVDHEPFVRTYLPGFCPESGMRMYAQPNGRVVCETRCSEHDAWEPRDREVPPSALMRGVVELPSGERIEAGQAVVLRDGAAYVAGSGKPLFDVPPDNGLTGAEADLLNGKDYVAGSGAGFVEHLEKQNQVLGKKPVRYMTGFSCPTCGADQYSEGQGVTCSNGHLIAGTV